MNASDLQCFCADADDIWERPKRPWSRGDYTYATNGRIMIQTPRIAGVPENQQAPDCAGLMAEIPAAVQWIPVPMVAALLPRDCDKCHGDGVRECDMGHEHDCDECYGIGLVRQQGAIAIGDAHYEDRKSVV